MAKELHMSERTVEGTSTAITVADDMVIIRTFRQDDLDQIKSLSANGANSLCCDCPTDFNNITQTYFGRPHDHFWVADLHGKVIGTLALLVEKEQEIAHLHCLLVAPEWGDGHKVRRRLVREAATHARDHGSLKLIFHANLNEQRVAAYLHRLGFEFSRHREVNGKPALEFYLNLYQHPELPKDAE
jgi:ribosomal protein S18 acetylase RimI-like enzyme